MDSEQWKREPSIHAPSRMCFTNRGTSANYYTVLSDVISDISTNTYLEITTTKNVAFTMRNSVFCDLIYLFFHY